MNNTEKYWHYPNVYRVAQELARCKHPDMVLYALAAMLVFDPGLLEGGAQDG